MSIKTASVLDIVEIATSLIDSTPEEQKTASELERDLQCAVMFLALGESNEAVCRKFGLTYARLDGFLKTQAGLDLLLKLQSGLFTDPQERVQRMQHLALDAQMRLMVRGSDAVVAKVAQDILDRGGGKAVQRIETRSTISVTNIQDADRMLSNQQEKLRRLEEVRTKMLSPPARGSNQVLLSGSGPSSK